MENWWIWAIFAAALLLGSFISGAVSASYFRRAAKDGEALISAPRRKNDGDQSEEQYSWEKEGRHRGFETQEFELPKEDFFENEKTELPGSVEEIFSGIPEDEAEKLLCEAGLLNTDSEESHGRG